MSKEEQERKMQGAEEKALSLEGLSEWFLPPALIFSPTSSSLKHQWTLSAIIFVHHSEVDVPPCCFEYIFFQCHSEQVILVDFMNEKM